MGEAALLGHEAIRVTALRRVVALPLVLAIGLVYFSAALRELPILCYFLAARVRRVEISLVFLPRFF